MRREEKFRVLFSTRFTSSHMFTRVTEPCSARLLYRSISDSELITESLTYIVTARYWLRVARIGSKRSDQ
jgi:hypothetical protein